MSDDLNEAAIEPCPPWMLPRSWPRTHTAEIAMTITAGSHRDLLMPYLAGLEGKFANRVEADLETDASGDLWLRLHAGPHDVRVHIAASAALDSGAYKSMFAPQMMVAFDVFDQLTRKESA